MKSKDNPVNSLQLAPKNNLYKEKFSENESYKNKDVTELGVIKNIRINSNAGVSEPKIVCSPLNKNILAVSANDFSVKENYARVFISKDKGAKWDAKEIPMSSKFKHSSYSDPWLDYDADGNLFFVAVQIDLENNFREGIFISKSTNNGDTWKSDFNFVDYNNKENILLDRPKLLINKSAENSCMFVTWIEIKGLTSFIMLSKSVDNGNKFSHPAVIEKDDVDYCNLSINDNGDLYIVYIKDDNKIIFEKSINSGDSWVKSDKSIEFNPPGIKSEGQFVIKNFNNKGIRINSEPSITFAKKDELVLTYTASGNGENISDIYFSKFNIQTGEVSVPVKVNSDNTNNDQFLPTISADTEGNIFIIYQDSRNDPENLLTETYVSYSIDDGLTFRDEKVSTGSFNPVSISVEKYFCDYNSSVLSDGKLISVWTDGRNNNFDLYAGVFNVYDFIESKKH